MTNDCEDIIFDGSKSWIPIYDISSGPFTPSITNFNTRDVLAALRSAGIIDRKNLSALVPVIIFDSLHCNSLLDFHRDGTTKWDMFTIVVDENYKANRPVVDSLLSDSHGNKVILRTREY